MNGGDISANTTNEEISMSDDERLDTIPHASNNGATKSD